ncbi:MAG: DUF4037 domain-containing protein [Methanomassiliicoccales archaeon]|nr:MAG: DUF4037 domain-containing protein [Methanomassiliicoccales archaeon]
MKKAIYRAENRYEEFLSAAKKISKKISEIDGVVGILATGGLGRGYCDDYSDLDLIVYADEKKCRKIGKYIAVEVRYKEIGTDTPVESYQRALRHKSPSKYWDQLMRWDRENSQILHDTDNRIKNMLKEKLVFPDREQKKLMEHHRQAADIHLMYDTDMWEKRGDMVNVSHALVLGTKHLILWIYAKNKKFQPYLPKWLFYHLENGSVPESKHFNTIKKPFIESIKTKTNARRIRNELIGLCNKIGLEFKFEDFEECFAHYEKNWEKASDKTKYYLSW